MIFLSILIILNKSHKINHDCDSNYTNINSLQNESFDYKISCSPKKIQYLYIKNYSNIKTISVLGETNVAIKCNPFYKYNNLSLLIFDKPTINFDENCNFNTVEIFDSPTIIISPNRQSNISVEKLIIFNSSFENSSYINSFKAKKVINAQKTNYKQILKNKSLLESYPNVFQCLYNLEFTLSNKAIIKCVDYYNTPSNYFDISMNYDVFKYCHFINYNQNPVVIARKIDYNLNYDLIETVIKSLFFYGQESFIFSNFFNMTSLDPYIQKYKSENSQLLITFDWPAITNYTICPWVDGEYQDKYKNLESYFDEIETNTSWRKICINNKGYLYFQENQLKGKMIISTATFFGVIALGIVVVLAIILSLYIIAYKLHYKKEKSLPMDENSKYDSIKNEEKEINTSSDVIKLDDI